MKFKVGDEVIALRVLYSYSNNDVDIEGFIKEKQITIKFDNVMVSTPIDYVAKLTPLHKAMS